MTRYYFNVWLGAQCIPDPEGSDFFDDESAQREAIEAACEIIGNRLLKRESPGLDHVIEVTKAGGVAVFRLSFADALRAVSDETSAALVRANSP